ncbi:MAG: fumarylacetoacetate hydrolase family protein, partial [Kiloniellaceae bacterium]
MHLLTFTANGRSGCGVRRGEEIVDLSVAAPELPGDWPGILAAGALDQVARAVETAHGAALVPAASARLAIPIPRPPKIVCIGLNYRSHAIESGMDIPHYPVVFARWANSLVGHGEALVRPAASTDFDYEAELAVVIGAGGRHIPAARALDHVAGYTACNEGSVRDFQFKSSQWAMGKTFDRSGAMGPAVVTADELPPGAAGRRIAARVKGETRPDRNTGDMIFDVATLVSTLSQVMTLEPGDVIVTGTPPGVGFARKPPAWLAPGDTVEVQIEGIGTLANPVVAE